MEIRSRNTEKMQTTYKSLTRQCLSVLETISADNKQQITSRLVQYQYKKKKLNGDVVIHLNISRQFSEEKH